MFFAHFLNLFFDFLLIHKSLFETKNTSFLSPLLLLISLRKHHISLNIKYLAHLSILEKNPLLIQNLLSQKLIYFPKIGN